MFCAVLPLPLLVPSFPLLLAAFVLFGIGIGALDVSMNAHAVLVEERYERPIMSSLMVCSASVACSARRSPAAPCGWDYLPLRTC